MNSIHQVQQDMLSQMSQIKALSEGGPVLPAQGSPVGVGQAFADAIRSVDAEQHKSSQAMAAVDSGQSEDLVGAMLQSQKASISFSALMQVRNKLATAFDDIMRMPL